VTLSMCTFFGPSHLVVQSMYTWLKRSIFSVSFPWQGEISNYLFWITQPPGGSLQSLYTHSIKYPVAAESQIPDTLPSGPTSSDMPGGVTPQGNIALNLFCNASNCSILCRTMPSSMNRLSDMLWSSTGHS
jgi:hypothetical protein